MASVRLEVARPERLSRGILLLRTFFSWLYVGIPHYFCLFFMAIVAGLFQFIAFWAILFTGRYPKGLFDFVMGVLDWQNRIGMYTNFLRDEYPPFGLAAEYPAKVAVDFPERLSRGVLLLKVFFGFLYVGIPHAFCLYFRMIAHGVVSFVAWFAVLFTGKMPESMHRFLTGTYRWVVRVSAYMWFLTDEYPPFSGKPGGDTVGTGVAM